MHSKASAAAPGIFTLALAQLWSACWQFCWRRLNAWPPYFYWRLSRRIPTSARKKHTYLSGSSGSGKTEVLKVLIAGQRRKRHPGTTILLDPDGDFAAQVARWKQNRTGERCVILDLSLKEGFTPVINPLQLTDRSPENIDLMAQLFISAFDEIMDSSQLTLNMKVILQPCLSVLMELGDASLPDLQRLLDEERNAGLLARVRQTQAYRRHREFFEYHFDQTDFHQTKRAISKKIQSLLNYRAFYYLTVGKSTVDLQALMNSRKLVIFNLSKGKLGQEAMPAFGKFLVAMLQGLAQRRAAVKEPARVPVDLFIDECHHFITPSIQDILKGSRKFGLYLTLTQQTVGADMSAAMVKSMMTNTEVKVTGANDIECLAQMAGKTYADPGQLYRLRRGWFAVKVGKGLRPPSFLFHTPPFLLGDANAMTDAEWQALTEQQIKAYYKPVPVWSEPPPVELLPGNDPAEFSPPPPAAPNRRRRRQLPQEPKYPF